MTFIVSDTGDKTITLDDNVLAYEVVKTVVADHVGTDYYNEIYITNTETGERSTSVLEFKAPELTKL